MKAMETRRISFLIQATFLPLKTSTNCMVKTHHVQHQLLSDTSTRGAMWASHKDVTPNAGGWGKTPLRYSRDSSHKLEARPSPLVHSTVQGVLCWTHRSLDGRCYKGGLWEEKAQILELATEAKQLGWSTKIYPVEDGCQGFFATSMVRLLRDLEISGKALR